MPSAIWTIGLYRKTENKEEAECIFCKDNGEKKTTISTKGGSTSGLVTHLRTKHAETEFFKKFQQGDRSSHGSASLNQYLYVTGGGGPSLLDKKVINYVCPNLVSFKSLNHPTTIALIKTSVESLKEESHYRKTVLPKAYEAVRSQILAEMSEMEALSFTTDIWSGPNESFISLTAHGIGKNWERRNFSLCVREFPGSHTGERVSAIVRGMLKEWKIIEDKCFIFLRDGGANMRKAFLDDSFNEQKLASTDCAAHMLNLVVKDALNHEPILKLLEKCRKIVSHFKQSNVAKSKYKEIHLEEDLPTHVLLQEEIDEVPQKRQKDNFWKRSRSA